MKLASIVFCAAVVNACGVAVHLELVDRLTPLLPQRIAQHKNYIRSGAFYPDAFYDCRGQYDVAEDAHWPPFLGKGVELVQERKLKGEDTSKLEAFLVGILSHQVGDVSWHSLGLFQGLLQAMADTEFNGDYDKAHSVLDIGGDMVQLSRHSNKSEKNAHWEYDVEDIEALVQKSGYLGIPRSSIHYCMARGQAAYTGELKVADVAHKRYSRRSPMMFDQLETYFTGGLTDIHEQIEECLPELLRWMSDGIDKSNYWEICPVFEGRYEDDPEKHYHHGDLLFNEIDGLKAELEKNEEEDGPLYKKSFGADSIVEILYDGVTEAKKKLKPSKVFDTLDCSVISAPEVPSPSTIGEISYPQFGSSVLYWGQNLMIGAPTENKVYLYDKKLVKNVIKSPNPTKEWGQFPSHFGTSLVVWNNHIVVSSPGINELDLYDTQGKWKGGFFWPNASTAYGKIGIKMIGETLAVHNNTLFVGAPKADLKDIEQSGVVYSISEDMLRSTLHSKHYTKLDTDSNILNYGYQAYQRFGNTLASSSLGLLVGSPGVEELGVFSGWPLKRTMTLRSETLNKLKPSGFGSYLVAANEDYMVVGAPSGSLDDHLVSGNQEGVMIVYTKDREYMISGNDEFQWFGRAGVIEGDNAYIVSPHAQNGYGMLWRVDLRARVSEEIGVPPKSFKSGFGASITSNGTHLAIGMPYWKGKTNTRYGGVAFLEVM